MAGLIVSWTDRSELEDGFRIEWGTDGATFPNSATVAADVETCTIAGLASNARHFVQVRATSSTLEDSAIEGPVGVYTQPTAAPSALTAEATGPSTVDLSWTTPYPEPANGGYKIYRAFDGGEFEAIAEVANGVSTYTVSGLASSSAYAFRVVAFNDNGTRPDSETDTASTVEVVTAAEANPPTLLSATIDATGLILTEVYDEAVQVGSGGSGGKVLSASGGAVSQSYSLGSGTSTLLWSLSRAIEDVETVTQNYTQPGSGIEDLVGNDLASYSGAAVTNGSAVVGWLLTEDFESGTNGWTAPISPNFAYATAPAPLEGAMSVAFTGATQSAFKNFTAQDEVWLYCLLNLAGSTSSPSIRDASGNILARAQFMADGSVRSYCGSSFTGSGTGFFLFNTTQHVKLRYVKGTGANAICQVHVSLDGVTWNNPAPKTNGTPTAQASRVHILTDVATLSIYDKIRVTTNAIGNAPA